MQVGAVGQPTTTLLMDIANNGNRSSPSSFEALYLNYDGADVDQNGNTAGDEGLYVAAGSTLVLNGIHLYAWHAGGIVPRSHAHRGVAQRRREDRAIHHRRHRRTSTSTASSTARDIDLEFAAVNGHSNHPFFDLNGDGSVTMADVDTLVHSILHRDYGDANLDGIVDIQDLTIVANNWQQSLNSWADGDMNGDGIVDIQDFTIVANHWQQVSHFTDIADQSGAALRNHRAVCGGTGEHGPSRHRRERCY